MGLTIHSLSLSLSQYRQILAKLLRIRRFIVSWGVIKAQFLLKNRTFSENILKVHPLDLPQLKKTKRGKNPYTFLMYEVCNKKRVRTMLQSEACRTNLCLSPFTERFQRATIIFLLSSSLLFQRQ